ncbi:MAG: FAD:protein FMN transferase [Chloroflexi bacterium]|nr:FAD:protein FMN transferase [Chloroflexota bacterium]
MSPTDSLISSPLDRVEHIMGMPIGIDVRDPDVDPASLDRAFDWFRRVDATFSTYKPDSQISRLNRRKLTLEEADADVREILERCERLRLETDGYFDARVRLLPGVVDPSGLVKGWSVDRAAAILEDSGARDYCINAGGDVRVRGNALPDTSWRIGIQHPLLRYEVAAVVVADDLAIATSGTYARGNHIVDPHTGFAPTGVLSVTIVGPDLGTADAYATAAFAMGRNGPAWPARLVGGYEAMTILDDETVLSTPGFPAGT